MIDLIGVKRMRVKILIAVMWACACIAVTTWGMLLSPDLMIDLKEADMLKVIAIVVALLVAGCSSGAKNQYSQYAECTLPVTRDAGMGVRVDGCSAWAFKPTRSQMTAFEARQNAFAK
jgi:hypothetical protein